MTHNLDLDLNDLGPLFTPRADETKRASYTLYKSGLMNKKQAVLELLRDGELTNRQLAKKLELKAGDSVTREIFNLREEGLVVKGQLVYDSDTGRTVQAWRLKEAA